MSALQTHLRATGIQIICKAVIMSAETVTGEQCGLRKDKESTPGCPTLESGEKRRHHQALVPEAEKRHEMKEEERCLSEATGGSGSVLIM